MTNFINPKIASVTARAPASIANLGVGFDLLGMSMDQLFDEVKLTKIADKKITIKSIKNLDGQELTKLSKAPEQNTAGKPLIELLEKEKLPFGFEVEIVKGIPLSSGLGGSAASAVASIVAANGFFIEALPVKNLMALALKGEALASGVEHADNVAPCLLGGMVACLRDQQFQSLPVPADFHVLVIYPKQELETKKARAALPAQVAFNHAIENGVNLAGFLIGLYGKNTTLALKHLDDLLVLPYRKGLIDSYEKLERLIENEAGTQLKLHISGAGSTLFVAFNQIEVLQKLKEIISTQLEFSCYLQSGAARGALIVEKREGTL